MILLELWDANEIMKIHFRSLYIVVLIFVAVFCIQGRVNIFFLNVFHAMWRMGYKNLFLLDCIWI